MPRGSKPGERRGGRKAGSANLKTRAIADKAAREGITPLEVLLRAMLAELKQDNIKEAAAYARDAAPYMHPRLSAVAAKVRNIASLDELSDQELEALARAEGVSDGALAEASGGDAGEAPSGEEKLH